MQGEMSCRDVTETLSMSASPRAETTVRHCRCSGTLLVSLEIDHPLLSPSVDAPCQVEVHLHHELKALNHA